MFLITLLLATELLGFSPYRGVVVDDKTHQPVPAATVLLVIDGGRYEGTQSQGADALGRFRLDVEGPTVHLRVSSPGYSPADLTRPLLSGGGLDTIRLTALCQDSGQNLSKPSAETGPKKVGNARMGGVVLAD